MHSLHPRLQEQLARLGWTQSTRTLDPERLRPLLNAVSRDYREAEEQRAELERSLDISSLEMEEVHARRLEEQERSATILDALEDGVCQVTESWRTIFLNTAAEQMLGWEAFEASERDLLQMLGVVDGTRVAPLDADRLRSELESGQSVSVADALVRHEGGGRTPVTVSFGPHFVEGRFAGAVVVLHDRTKSRKIEEELEEAKIEAEVSRRADPTGLDFVSRMSHEIRTPLSGIFGMVELLDSTELGEEQRHYLETARRSAQSLLSVFNDIHDFAEMQTGAFEVERIPFDLHRAAHEVADVLEPAAREKDVQLIVRYDPSAPRHVVGDPGRIRQVLRSLAAHAVSRSREGHVLVDLEIAGEEDSGGMLRVTVDNTGSGIPADRLESIFDSYTPGDLLNRHWAGTGLSMALSKRLVDLMGGKIGASSRIGFGSTFWFEIPVGLGFEKPEFVRAENLDGVRTMVVDSTPAGRMELENQVTRLGARCTCVPSAAEALTELRSAYAEGDPFRVVLLSTQLQEMYAETLGDLVKGDPTLRYTDLVLLPSLGKQGDATYLSEIGFSGYIVKPVAEGELEETLRLVWGARRAGREPGLVTRHTLADAATLAREAETAPAVAKPRILVADECASDRRLARAFLEDLGYRVDVAASGRDAVHFHEENPYDVILLHVTSGEVDGDQATIAIRARELANGHDTPILLMAPSLLEEDGDRGLDVGYDDLLAKPFRPEDLAAKLARWVRAPADPKSDEGAASGVPGDTAPGESRGG